MARNFLGEMHYGCTNGGTAGLTLINYSDKADAPLTIDTVQLVLYAAGDVMLGCFVEGEGGTFTTVATADLGALAEGVHQISGLSLAMPYLGMLGVHCGVGRLGVGTATGVRLYYKSGLYIPCELESGWSAEEWDSLALAAWGSVSVAPSGGSFPLYDPATAVLGTPVAVSTSPTYVEQPCNGCLVSVTDLGITRFREEVDTGLDRVKYAGWLAFGDGSTWEEPQYIDLTARVYTAKSFAQATQILVVTYNELELTVTPWQVAS